jgi:uncharacterized membrane protein YesL
MKFSILIQESYRTISENWALLVIISSLWTLLSMTMILAPPATVGIFYCVRKLIIEGDAGIRDFFKGMWRFFVKAWLMGMAFLGALAIFTYDTLWLVGREAPLLKILAIVPFALLVGLLLLGNYLFVFLVREGGHIAKAIRKSFLLAFDNLTYTMALTVLLGIITALLVYTRFLAAAFLMGIIGVTQSHAVKQLLRKYGLKF